MSDKLLNHKQVWEKKRILREIYAGWYKKIIKDLKPTGKTLELGSGSGNFKEFKPDLISSDIDACPWLDMCLDAHSLPFEPEAIANIVMIDVLHHLANPMVFFQEALRVLEKGGKIVLLEPYPTLFSLIVCKIFHPEPFVMNADYFVKKDVEAKDPWDSNQAMAYLLFFKHKAKFLDRFCGKFKIIKRHKMSCILYPASGGFEHKALIPDFLIPVFKFLEFCSIPLRWLLAFRCYVVLEKS